MHLFVAILPTDTDKSATYKYWHQYRYNYISIGGILCSEDPNGLEYVHVEVV